MKYMMLLFDEEQDEDMSPEAMAPWIKFGEDAKAIAKEVAGEALQPSTTARVVSVRDGKAITTNGPLADTKEQLGGFYIFDCANLEVAIKLASMIPCAPTGHVEVRPVVEFG